MTDWRDVAAETLASALASLDESMRPDDTCPLSVKERIDIAKCAAEIVFEAQYGDGAESDED